MSEYKIINKVKENDLRNKNAFWCKTEKDANELLKQLDKYGYKWHFTGNRLIEDNAYYKHKNKTCYCIYTKIRVITYGELDYFKNTSCNIFIFQKQNNKNITQSIKHIINGTTTIVILEDGSKGIAKLHPNDEFDKQIGFEIAYKRALGIYDNKDNIDISEAEFWDGFLNNKIAIKIETEKEAKKFQMICENKYIHAYNMNNYFLRYYNSDTNYFTCHKLDIYKFERSDINYQKKKGRIIVKFKDIFKSNSSTNNLSQYTNEELLKELKSRLNN